MSEKLSNTELIGFFEQMGVVIQSGLSVLEGVDLMREDYADMDSHYGQVLSGLYETLEGTGIFSLAMQETGAFPDYVVSMTEIGERTGNLEEVMFGLARYYEREENLIQDIKNACSYPLMMMAMMLVILLVLIIKVVPIFNQVYEQMGSQMQGAGLLLLALSNAMRRYYYIFIALAVLLAAVLLWLGKSARGRKLLRTFFSRYLSTGQMIHKISASRFTMIMAITLRSGMDYDTAFNMLEDIMTDDREMIRKMQQCREQMEEGISFGESVYQSKILTGMDARMVRIAEQAGRVDGALERIAARLDEEVTVRIQNFVAKIEPTLVIILSVLVGIILLSVMLPLMGILSGIA